MIHFDEIPTSTKTITILSNIKFTDIREIFNNLNIDNFIKYVKFGTETKGEKIRKNKKKPIHFHNTITIIVQHEKLLNFKISNNGTFQLTGCQKNKHCIECLRYLWDNYLSIFLNRYFIFEPKLFFNIDSFQILIIPCMKNINPSVGFVINKQKLINLIKTNEEFQKYIIYSDYIYEIYSGINIRYKIDINKLNNLKLKKLSFFKDITIHDYILYQEYIQAYSEKERKTRFKRPKYNTFLFFYSGKFIMSGMCTYLMKDIYEELIQLLHKYKNEIIFS